MPAPRRRGRKPPDRPEKWRGGSDWPAGGAPIASRKFTPAQEEDNEHDNHQKRHRNILQRLGVQERPADRVPPWMATERRRLGHADALFPRQGLSRRRP